MKLKSKIKWLLPLLLIASPFEEMAVGFVGYQAIQYLESNPTAAQLIKGGMQHGNF